MITQVGSITDRIRAVPEGSALHFYKVDFSETIVVQLISEVTSRRCVKLWVQDCEGFDNLMLSRLAEGLRNNNCISSFWISLSHCQRFQQSDFFLLFDSLADKTSLIELTSPSASILVQPIAKLFSKNMAVQKVKVRMIDAKAVKTHCYFFSHLTREFHTLEMKDLHVEHSSVFNYLNSFAESISKLTFHTLIIITFKLQRKIIIHSMLHMQLINIKKVLCNIFSHVRNIIFKRTQFSSHQELSLLLTIVQASKHVEALILYSISFDERLQHPFDQDDNESLEMPNLRIVSLYFQYIPSKTVSNLVSNFLSINPQLKHVDVSEISVDYLTIFTKSLYEGSQIETLKLTVDSVCDLLKLCGSFSNFQDSSFYIQELSIKITSERKSFEESLIDEHTQSAWVVPASVLLLEIASTDQMTMRDQYLILKLILNNSTRVVVSVLPTSFLASLIANHPQVIPRVLSDCFEINDSQEESLARAIFNAKIGQIMNFIAFDKYFSPILIFSPQQVFTDLFL